MFCKEKKTATKQNKANEKKQIKQPPPPKKNKKQKTKKKPNNKPTTATTNDRLLGILWIWTESTVTEDGIKRREEDYFALKKRKPI